MQGGEKLSWEQIRTLLAAVDEAHDTRSGAATRKILEREFSEFGKHEYQRWEAISVAHRYRLRNSTS